MRRNQERLMVRESYKFLKIAVLAAVFFIPFGTKKFIHVFWGVPNELSSAFLYGTDILLAVAFLLFIFLGDEAKKHVPNHALLAVFLVLAGASMFFSLNAELAEYAFIRIVVASFFALLLASSLRGGLVSLKEVFTALAIGATVQSIVGFLQFLFGHGLNLRILGEPTFDDGVARVFIQGTHYLRAYGTMAHANILAAFLGLGLLALFGWWLFSYSRNLRGIQTKMLFGAGFFVILIGFVSTFSRSGWLALAATFLFVFLVFFFTKRKDFFSIVTPFVIAVALVVVSMNWAIAPRAHLSASEPSVDLRVRYNEIGLKILNENPFGIGIGNTVPFAIQKDFYREVGITRPSDFQPIHNFYIMVAVELGAQGFISIIALLLYLIYRLFKRVQRFEGNESEYFGVVVSSSMLIFVLLFGLFDHFFWTIESGRLMFWCVLGIVMGISSLPAMPAHAGRESPRRSMDRTLASEAGN